MFSILKTWPWFLNLQNTRSIVHPILKREFHSYYLVFQINVNFKKKCGDLFKRWTSTDDFFVLFCDDIFEDFIAVFHMMYMIFNCTCVDFRIMFMIFERFHFYACMRSKRCRRIIMTKWKIQIFDAFLFLYFKVVFCILYYYFVITKPLM